ncbi:MAG: 2-amino-4-hydroxy-6-hydroxymethyldihydropteridine diphosphokinase [Candidatus Eisenbacteria bacterium]|nr:2-amino-4-hydroxy-6-hydroxymethyldihydropteridine diphosphokinase [Candidatus Eisenbacteria bacterium]
MQNPRPVAIALGSNLGDRAALLGAARERIAADIAPLEGVSRIYETDPVGPPQPCYLNQVVLLRSAASPEAILATLLGIEHALGRVRTAPARHGPRRIDCDLLLCGETERRASRLTLPHPRMSQRAFVLVPLVELLPDWRHPREGWTVRERLACVGRAGVRPWRGEAPADGSRGTGSADA